MTDPYTLWCERHGCTHGHCGLHDCEHPQPFGVVFTGETAVRLICGRCWVVNQEISEMIPCLPEVCQ